MSDQIVNPDTVDWTYTPSNKGRTKYQHLLDGNARLIDITDYGYDKVENFRIMISALATKKGFTYRAKKISERVLAFQVTGKKESLCGY